MPFISRTQCVQWAPQQNIAFYPAPAVHHEAYRNTTHPVQERIRRGGGKESPLTDVGRAGERGRLSIVHSPFEPRNKGKQHEGRSGQKKQEKKDERIRSEEVAKAERQD